MKCSSSYLAYLPFLDDNFLNDTHNVRQNVPFFPLALSSAKHSQTSEAHVNRAKGSVPTHFSYVIQSRTLLQH